MAIQVILEIEFKSATSDPTESDRYSALAALKPDRVISEVWEDVSDDQTRWRCTRVFVTDDARNEFLSLAASIDSSSIERSTFISESLVDD